jgi:hypothetical protein
VAALAAYPQEAVLEAAALEIGLELPFDIRRQERPLRRQLRGECRVVFPNELIQERALRAMARVARAPALASLPAGNGNMLASLRDGT